MPSSVARPVQYAQEGHDADGHALASHFVGSNQMRLHLQEGQIRIFQSHKSKKGKKHPGTDSMVRVPKKVRFEKNCNLCKKHGGMYTIHNTCDCCRFEKDGKEKSDFRLAKKDGRKLIP